MEVGISKLFIETVIADQHKGSDRVRLWNLRTRTEIKTPAQNYIRFGQVTCVFWVYRQSENDEILCYRTSLGYTVFWGKSPNGHGPGDYYELYTQRCSENEIMCITSRSFGIGDTRLIIGAQDSVIQLWKMGGSTIENMFSVKIPRTVPSAVAFIENSKDILVFGREDGTVCVYVILTADCILIMHQVHLARH